MDRLDSLRVSSLRRNSSSVWRSEPPEAFSRSTQREEDDEVDLRWAALEKLPTYDRLRKGILNVAPGDLREVNIKKLGYQERKILLDRLLKVAEEDNEKFLLKLRNRIDQVGIDLPTIEVRFEHLNIDVEAHVGSRALPTFFNFTVNAIEGFLNRLGLLSSRKTTLSILRNVTGIIKPGRLTLLLGPPASGKTTLLLALAGKLDPDLKVSGKVTYNGHEMNEFVPQRTAAYISQYDFHLGEMTVRETLAFSARCQGVGTGYEMLQELTRREKEASIKPDPDIDVFMKAAALTGNKATVVADYILKILGLEICADTFVGDEMFRGISGGQKKRLTTGEMLVGPAKALLMDEISTGLDASTTFQIVSAIRQSIHILNGTALVSLLQPAPETYDLFDDIMLLSEGQIVYQGPREHILEFFETMGFKCPQRKDAADFLQEVTSRKDQEQYWANRDEPYHYVPVVAFAEAFQSFHVGRSLGDELATPFDRSKSHPAALTTSKYGASMKELVKACIEREYLIMKRNWFVFVFKVFQLVLVAIITMTVCLRTEMNHDTLDDGVIYMGSLFLGLFVSTFNGLAELTLAIYKLPVFYKQRDFLFFPSWAYTLPIWVLRIPISIVEVAVWVAITYYPIGYDSNVSRMFKQYLVLLSANQMASGLFRVIAAVGRSMIVAQTFGACVLVLMTILGGFLLSRDDVKIWWKWGYWTSPLMYAQNAISVNEFLGRNWDHNFFGGNLSLGVVVLKYRGIFTQEHWYWLGLGAVTGFVLLYNAIFPLALHILDPFGKAQPVLSEEALKEKHANRTGELTRLTAEEGRGTTANHVTPGRNEGRNTVSEGSFSFQDTGANASQERRGMVLPFVPLSITFENIYYSVDMPEEMRSHGALEDRLVLLKGLNGTFRPGVLTALMGVSGAGKTTLLDVLAGRKTGGYIEGNITISGYSKKQETFARISGYCEQNDIHSPNVTVHESLIYSAWLRLPADIESKTREMFVEEVMQLVELSSLRGSLVGLPGINGLSTEQRKRMTIAVELVANPSIIFMDEPTSGLDARAAAIVMRTVRNIVDTGRTVVCTIHQPSTNIFEAFDELFLLKRGGEEIYVGPLGHNSCQMIKYFEEINGVSKIKEDYNPATWMLEITTPAQEEALGVDFAELYQQSEAYRRSKALIKELSRPPPGSRDLYFPTQYAQSFLAQCMACLWKQHWSYWRNTEYTAVRFWFTVFVALMFGSIFWDLGNRIETQQDLLNALGSIYLSCLSLGIQNSSSVQPVVAVERTVFYRERAAGMYSALPYAIAQVVIELPYVLVQNLVYGIIIYSMVGFEWTAIKFFSYLFYSFTTLLCFTYFGMMNIGISPNQNIAVVISVAFFMVWNLFSGFIIPRTRIPVWWRWNYWTDPLAWNLYGLIASQYGDVEHTLDLGLTVKEFLRYYFGYKHEFLGVVSVMSISIDVMFALMFATSIKLFNFQRR